ncbi:MAG: dihydrofolate reductase family protein [Candidatus Bathyarchaeota archaeon]|nr:MAG: dihydrofolate reductase family protein [Candidatus Bathyarchaeota archaeon]
MLPKVIVHNSISIDGSLINFEVNMPLHYKIAGNFNSNMHLVGSNTAKIGIDLFLKEIPQETQDDFKKPNKKGVLWAIPDTTGKMKGLLHVLRQSEYCKDAILLISEKTSKEYIRYLKERNYNYHVVGKDKCNLRQSLELLNEKYNAKTILTDTGSILSNLLIKHGLVSEISLLFHPVVVGRKAYNLFTYLDKSLKLELTKNESFEKGYFWNLYRI